MNARVLKIRWLFGYIFVPLLLSESLVKCDAHTLYLSKKKKDCAKQFLRNSGCHGALSIVWKRPDTYMYMYVII